MARVSLRQLVRHTAQTIDQAHQRRKAPYVPAPILAKAAHSRPPATQCVSLINISWHYFMAYRREISLLDVGLVLVTATTAIAHYFIPGFS